MVNLFRNIRKQLANESKFQKYFRYAFGEVALIMIGIFMALQLNNWNESRKSKEQFKATLEQIYTVLDQDNDNFINIKSHFEFQIAIIDSLLANPNSLDPNILPYLLYYVDTYPDPFESEIPYQLGFLKFDPKNNTQSSLSKSLASYAKVTKIDHIEYNKSYTTPLLNALELPNPITVFGWSVINNYQNIETTFFDVNQKKLMLDLLENSTFKNALKSLRNQKLRSILSVNMANYTALTNMKLIKDYDPEIKLLYQNIGILGDATQNNYIDENIPLKKTNDNLSIWEGDITLNQGTVKFREGNNWTFNWGGDTFPKGTNIFFGNNIVVESGNYHVILNLTENTYEFIKQED